MVWMNAGTKQWSVCSQSSQTATKQPGTSTLTSAYLRTTPFVMIHHSIHHLKLCSDGRPLFLLSLSTKKKGVCCSILTFRNHQSVINENILTNMHGLYNIERYCERPSHKATSAAEASCKQHPGSTREAKKRKATYDRKYANPSRFEVCCVCVFYGLVLEPPLITKFLDPPLKCLLLVTPSGNCIDTSHQR